MTIKKKLIGYGYTDSNGVATLDYNENGTEISTLAPTGNSGYIGRGVGNVQIEAGLHSSDTVVSEPSNVLDTTFYDKGLSGSGNYNDNWDSTNTISVSRDAEGTTLEYVPSTSSYGQRFPNNKIETPISNCYCIEFDVMNFNGYCIAQLDAKLASSSTQYIGYQLRENGHFKGIIDGESYKLYVNDTKIIDRSLSNVISTIFEFVFAKVQGEATVKYKNFIIYPI